MVTPERTTVRRAPTKAPELLMKIDDDDYDDDDEDDDDDCSGNDVDE